MHKSVTMVKFKNKAGIATTKPVTTVAYDGVLYFGALEKLAINHHDSYSSDTRLSHLENNKTLAIAITALTPIIADMIFKSNFFKYKVMDRQHSDLNN
jgi:hypothetical protein